MVMLTKLRRLSRRERKLLMKACVLLPVAVARVRLHLGMPAGITAPAPSGAAYPVLFEAVRMVRAAARRVPGASCLPQSLVVHQLLLAEGIPTSVRIGVRKSSGKLDAHAWVEYAGRPITDPSTVDQEFTVLAADSGS